jgi:hypothetical protein
MEITQHVPGQAFSGGEAVVAPGVHAKPALQLEHWMAPESAYLPAAHLALTGLRETDPTGQEYPASHGPEHVAFGMAGVAPYRPAGHTLQEPAEERLKVPGAQATALELVDPAGQAYPARHGPLQEELDSSWPPPHLPALQLVQVKAPGADH